MKFIYVFSFAIISTLVLSQCAHNLSHIQLNSSVDKDTTAENGVELNILTGQTMQTAASPETGAVVDNLSGQVIQSQGPLYGKSEKIKPFPED